VTSKSSPACFTAFLMVFHHESESGAWLISTYLPAACAAPRLIVIAAAIAKVFSTRRLVTRFMVLSPSLWGRVGLAIHRSRSRQVGTEKLCF
jgi:hypothetical protein